MKTFILTIRYVLAVVPLACVALLSSCSADDAGSQGGGESNAPVSVRLKVSSGDMGDLNASRAAGDDENADKHEFMNTLRLYIVNNTDNTVIDLSPIDLSSYGDGSAATGDLVTWTSADVTINPGTYTVYAFANVDGYQGEYGAAGSATPVEAGELLDECFGGQTAVLVNLNSFRLYNPVSKMDLENGKYIPMSASQEVTVTSSTREISIELIRLVSKVRITVNEGAELSGGATLKFYGYSENVPLMGTDSDPVNSADVSYYGGREKSSENSVSAGSTVYFYVNETPKGNGFTVTLNTGNNKGGISMYQAITERDNIPRNSIYPLTLTFDETGIQLEPKAYLEVLGKEYPVEYDVIGDGTYIFGITYGSYLTITPSVAGAGTSTFTWHTVEGNPDGMGEGNEDLAASLGLTLTEGSTLRVFTADENIRNNKYTLRLTAEWTSTDGEDRNHDYNRTYNVIVRISQDYNIVLDGIIDNLNLSPSRTRSAVTTISPERLNMIKVK